MAVQWRQKHELQNDNYTKLLSTFPPICNFLVAAATAPSNLVPTPDGQFFWIGLW